MTDVKVKKEFSIGAFMGSILRHQIFIPAAALVILLLINLVGDFFKDSSFFTISLLHNSAGNPVLSGNLISVLDFGSELAILAIGMTLVTAATGGQDISVGATIAIAGSVVLRIVCGADGVAYSVSPGTLILAFGAACVVAMICGAFNGVLVAIFRIQPMIATLILFTAGRSIASWINGGALPRVNAESFTYFAGFIPGIPIPTPFFVAVGCIIIIAIVLKVTNLGLYTQAVGINESSSKLNGINPVSIKILSFVILGLCVAVCGLLKVSRASGITYSVIAKDIEMDAILAVALGGNALSGGKFNMTASIMGAYVIQMLTTTLYRFEVEPDALPAYKAIVVIVLVVISAPTVREKAKSLWTKMTKGQKKVKEVA
ncbi:MAG: ABC transporter permease [Lachnospiraceae bacterium]|nr:ABC transporter permease [Lachnospiraceae bacterium]